MSSPTDTASLRVGNPRRIAASSSTLSAATADDRTTYSAPSTLSAACPLCTTAPSVRKERPISGASTAVPRKVATRCPRRGITVCVSGCGQTSRTPRLTCPPASWASKAAARFRARTVPCGSTPRSKRYEASLRRPSLRAVRRTVSGTKYALSSRTSVVCSRTSEFAPPMTPAIATARSRSQINRSSGVRVRV